MQALKVLACWLIHILVLVSSSCAPMSDLQHKLTNQISFEAAAVGLHAAQCGCYQFHHASCMFFKSAARCFCEGNIMKAVTYLKAVLLQTATCPIKACQTCQLSSLLVNASKALSHQSVMMQAQLLLDLPSQAAPPQILASAHFRCQTQACKATRQQPKLHAAGIAIGGHVRLTSLLRSYPPTAQCSCCRHCFDWRCETHLLLRGCPSTPQSSCCRHCHWWRCLSRQHPLRPLPALPEHPRHQTDCGSRRAGGA